MSNTTLQQDVGAEWSNLPSNSQVQVMMAEGKREVGTLWSVTDSEFGEYKVAYISVGDDEDGPVLALRSIDGHTISLI